MSKHIPPAFRQKAFHCPTCDILSTQTWSDNIACNYVGQLASGGQGHTTFYLQNTLIAKCGNCQQISIWIDGKMVHPLTGNVEHGNTDLPADILNDYNEAKNIVNISPRGAAALLRLSLQKLCGHLGEKGKNINDDIANLVKRGLPIQLQQALDSVRVIGNHAVHPGVIDLDDKPETAFALFSFVNIICDYFITQPKKIAEVFDNLPQKDKDNIAKKRQLKSRPHKLRTNPLMEAKEKICFIIMPISDIEGYEPGHFKRVYEYIIKPACQNAGFAPIRADDIKKTNVIVIDILQKLLNSEMAVCDLSGKNPNVLYELGIRQAFDLPVSFIKDDITTRVFDIQGFRDLEYNSNLRIDEVNSAIEKLTLNISETFDSKGQDVNSIVELLGISKAKVTKHVEISPDTDLILKTLSDISLRLGNIENNKNKSGENILIVDDPFLEDRKPVAGFIHNNEEYKINDKVVHERFGKGTILTVEINKSNEPIAIIDFELLGKKQLYLKFAKLSKMK